MVFLLLSLFLTAPDVSVNVPDSVQAGEVFLCEITLIGENLTSLDCQPLFSNGLQYMGSSSMHSFSTVTTPAGTSVSSEIRLLISFRASIEGTHTIGPLILTSSGRILYEIPAMTVTAHGNIPGTVSTDSPQGARQNEIAWMEIEIDTT